MIETKNLTKIFKIKKGEDIPAVVGLTLSVHEGEVFGFLGPNGAGKTTTVRMLTSLIGATSGSARVNGFVVGEEDQAIRRSVGILTESPGLYEQLSASKNLEIYANLYDVEDVDKQVGKYLKLLGLWPLHDRCCMNPDCCSWMSQRQIWILNLLDWYGYSLKTYAVKAVRFLCVRTT